MFIFNYENVYIGYSLEELEKVRNILSFENIKHKYKIINHNNQWGLIGTKRGHCGNFKINRNYEKQYNVYVKKHDYENAKYLIKKHLHKT